MQNEIERFFRLSCALAEAERTQDAEAVSDLLCEIVAHWLHGESTRLRARYERILEAHGMRAEMDQLCEQWAAL